MTHILRVTATVLLLGIAVVPEGLQGQEVRGTVLEEGTGQPVQGAFVELVAAPSGVRASAALTTEQGTFTLSASTPGLYRVRVERIGYRKWETEPFQLGAGQTVSRELWVPVQAVEVERLDVTVERQCVEAAEAGEATAQLWEQARAALSTAGWAEEQRRYRFTLLQYQETVVQPTGRIVEATAHSKANVAGAPFSSMAVAQLASGGFRQSVEDTTYYFAPDANVLLSDEFLNAHCLGLAPRGSEPQPGWVGLTFRPSEGWGEVDVAGTFWFARDPLRLQELHFRFTGVDAPETGAEYGGRVSYRRVPDGGWIVDRWTLRFPHRRVSGPDAGESTGATDDELDSVSVAPGAVVRAGGRVSQLTGLDGRRLSNHDGAEVTGSVIDYAHDRMASSVRVWLEGTDRWTVTDQVGAFTLRDVPPGRHRIRASLPATELAGLGPVADSVRVEEDGSVRMNLETPPGEEVARRVCGESDESPVLMVGWVTDQIGRPLPAAEVEAEWTRKTLTVRPGGRPPTLTRNRRSTETMTRSDGTYVLCNVSIGTVVDVKSQWRGKSGPETTVQTPPRGIIRVDMVVDGSTG